MRPPFDEYLSTAEVQLLAYLVKRGGRRPQATIERHYRARGVDVLLLLLALEGVWLERGIARGEWAWKVIHRGRAIDFLQRRGQAPPHHGGRIKW